MKKAFCDLCGQPAVAEIEVKGISRPFGEKRMVREYPNKEYEVRTAVTVTVHFGFENHPTGYGGPPDLCVNCILGLLDELKKSAEVKKGKK